MNRPSGTEEALLVRRLVISASTKPAPKETGTRGSDGKAPTGPRGSYSLGRKHLAAKDPSIQLASLSVPFLVFFGAP